MDKEKWRYQAIRTRLGLALNQNINTDVSFIFGTSDEKTIVSAHKLICQLSSSFLNELITKHEREQKSQARKGPLLISLGSNVCPILFKRLLKFIYTDQIDGEKIKDFLDLAISFGFTNLPQELLKSAKADRLTKDNVVCMLQIANYCQDPVLKNGCLEFIMRNANQLFQHKSLLEISEPDLDLLISSDDLNVKSMKDDGTGGGEFVVFLGVMSWANHKCKILGLDFSSQNLRNVLINLRLKIRYTFISYDKLLSEVKKSGILTPEEFIQMLKAYIDPTDNSLGICTKHRVTEIQNNDVKTTMTGCKRTLKNNESSSSKATKMQRRNESESSHNLPSTSINNNDGAYKNPIQDEERDCFIIDVPIQQQSIQFSDPLPLMQIQVEAMSMPQSPSFTNSYPSNLSSSPEEFILCDCTPAYLYILSLVEQKGFGLEHISLINVIILDFSMDSCPRVLLPNLKSFKYILDKNEPQPLPVHIPDRTHPYYKNTKGFLFFEKHQNGVQWLFSGITALGVEIMVKVYGLHVLGIYPLEQKLVLSFPPKKQMGDFIMESKTFKVKILALCGLTVTNPLRLLNNDNLEEIIFYGVELHNISAAGFINRLSTSKLRYISLYETSRSKRVSELHLATSLKRYRTTLEKLALKKMKVTGLSFNQCLQKVSPFVALTELLLNDCEWNPLFVSKFDTCFPKLKILHIHWSTMDCMFLKKILCLHGLQYVSLVGISVVNVNDRQTAEENWIKEFVSVMEIPVQFVQDAMIISEVLLQRSGDNNAWIKDENNTGAELMFKTCKLDMFFEHIDMLKFVNL